MAGKGQQLEWNSKAYGQTSKTTNECYQASKVTTVQGNQPIVCESTTRIRHEDKQSGSYERCTMKEKVSSGDVYMEKQTGRVGIQDEHTRKSTIKIGDKSGYTEYYNEQRFRQVDFGNEYSSKNTINDYQSDDESGSNNTYGPDDESGSNNTDESDDEYGSDNTYESDDGY